MAARDASPDSAAATWMSRRDAGWSAAEQVEFQAWRAASAANALAWAKVQAAWDVLERPRNDGLALAFARQLAVRRRRRRWRRAAATVGLAAAAGVALMFLAPAERAVESTARSEVRLVRSPQQVLPDGSVVELNRGAEIAVEYNAQRRGVRLVRGEAHFDVKKLPARPFVVTAGSVEVRAVGTAFAVRLDPGAVAVLVTAGRVAVQRPDAVDNAPDEPAGGSMTISAGDRVVVPATAVLPGPEPQSLSEADIARRLQWRGPRVELSGTRLADAIAILNQENRVQVTIVDSALAEMRMSGVFRVDDIEGFVDVLATSYGVEAERRGSGIALRRNEVQ